MLFIWCVHFSCFIFFVIWQYNYGGIKAKIAPGNAAEIVDDESQVEIISSWNISEYLPKETQVIFFDISESYFIYWRNIYKRVETKVEKIERAGPTLITLLLMKSYVLHCF